MKLENYNVKKVTWFDFRKNLNPRIKGIKGQKWYEKSKTHSLWNQFLPDFIISQS